MSNRVFLVGIVGWMVWGVGCERHIAVGPVPEESAPTLEVVSSGGGGSGTAVASYLLYAPLQSRETYLVNIGGQPIHRWASDYRPANAAYLNAAGSLLRAGQLAGASAGGFNHPDAGGIIESLAPDSTVEWAYEYASETLRQHHDLEPLPNGNVLVLGWELISPEEVRAAGRAPWLVPEGGLWVDHVVELEPQPDGTAQIVWRWSLWDHLVQNREPSLPTYGEPALHPGRVDINYVAGLAAGVTWAGVNSLDYHPERDHILLTASHFGEVWVIDHSPDEAEETEDTEEGDDFETRLEMGSTRGGNLLYRWGNASAYAPHVDEPARLIAPYDAQWVTAGRVGEGNIVVFSTPVPEPGESPSVGGGELTYGRHGEFVEFEAPEPLNRSEEYAPNDIGTFAPDGALTRLPVTVPISPSTNLEPEVFGATELLDAAYGAVERLPNGLNLVLVGADGYFAVVDDTGELVWDFTNPQGFDVPWQLDVLGTTGGSESANGLLWDNLTGQPPAGNEVYRGRVYLGNYPGLDALL